jgi:hypothetical protein
MFGLSSAFAGSLERTVSSSRQFVVYGAETRLRGAVADLAEHAKGNLLALLQKPDQWSIPILLRLQESQANLPEIPAASLDFSQTGAGLKIQLDLLVGREMEPRTVEREILRAILLEMSYRPLPNLPAGVPYVPAPDWLVDGILTFRNESPATFDALDSFAARPAPLQDLLAQQPALLDSQSRTLYRGAACALITILTQHEGGRVQLARYIADLPRSAPDSAADFRAHFPWFGNDAEEVEKNWNAFVKRMAEEQRFVLNTFFATAQQLKELRRAKIATDASGKNPLSLEETLRTSRANINIPAARELAQRFVVLAAHAHPLLSSIVIDYQLAAQSVAKKTTHGLGKRVARAAALLDQVYSRMHEVEDFMNWFEATQSRTASGDFQDYVRTAQSNLAITHRRDALSVYLDSMELQFQ